MKSQQQTLRNSADSKIPFKSRITKPKWPTRVGPRYELTSALAKKIDKFQSDCSIPGHFYNLNHAGLGSDLHVFSQVVALSMTSGRRLFTDKNKNPQWTWWSWLFHSRTFKLSNFGRIASGGKETCSFRGEDEKKIKKS